MPEFEAPNHPFDDTTPPDSLRVVILPSRDAFLQDLVEFRYRERYIRGTEIIHVYPPRPTNSMNISTVVAPNGSAKQKKARERLFKLRGPLKAAISNVALKFLNINQLTHQGQLLPVAISCFESLCSGDDDFDTNFKEAMRHIAAFVTAYEESAEERSHYRNALDQTVLRHLWEVVMVFVGLEISKQSWETSIETGLTVAGSILQYHILPDYCISALKGADFTLLVKGLSLTQSSGVMWHRFHPSFFDGPGRAMTNAEAMLLKGALTTAHLEGRLHSQSDSWPAISCDDGWVETFCSYAVEETVKERTKAIARQPGGVQLIKKFIEENRASLSRRDPGRMIYGLASPIVDINWVVWGTLFGRSIELTKDILSGDGLYRLRVASLPWANNLAYHFWIYHPDEFIAAALRHLTWREEALVAFYEGDMVLRGLISGVEDRTRAVQGPQGNPTAGDTFWAGLSQLRREGVSEDVQDGTTMANILAKSPRDAAEIFGAAVSSNVGEIRRLIADLKTAVAVYLVSPFANPQFYPTSPLCTSFSDNPINERPVYAHFELSTRPCIKSPKYSMISIFKFAQWRRQDAAKADDTADRALACIYIVAKTVNFSNSRRKHAFLDRVKADIQVICDWCLFLVARYSSAPAGVRGKLGDVRAAFLGLAESIMVLIKSDDTMLGLLVLERSYIDFLILFWGVREPRGNLLMSPRTTIPTSESNSVCPVLACMEMAVENSVGCERLVEVLMADTYKQSRFTRTILDRLEEMHNNKTMNLIYKLANMEALVEIIVHITGQAPSLRRPLQRAGYMVKFGVALDRTYGLIWQHADLARGSPEAAGDSVGLIGRLLLILLRSPTPVVCAYRDMIAGGLFQLAVRQTAAATKDKQVTAARFKGLIQSIGWFMYHPTIMLELIKADVPADDHAKLLASPELGLPWGGFRHMISVMAEAYRSFPSITTKLCDYHGCNRKKDGPSKQCAACSSVVYCSLSCQKRDWNEKHRSECRHARHQHHLRCSTGTWYPHSVRAFHAKIIRDLYVGLNFQLISESKSHYPDLPFHHTLPTTNFTSTGIIRRVKPLAPVSVPGFSSTEEVLWGAVGEDGKKAHLPQTWLKPRIFQLVERYRAEGGRNQNLRLVEASFVWGNRLMVILTIKLEPDAKGGLEADYCVQRYAEMPQD
ncbi:hypothetical protein NMY22_g9153 [Coprinellus aureogranulatus]|nr:hypothetical protein NMY22_g9153 [Coprinellus aureogranulatus]